MGATTVVDLGCGPGFWTLPLAEMVGSSGQVISLDVSPELLAKLSAQHPPPQVRLVQAELPAISLPSQSADLIWAAFIFHEVDPLAALVGDIKRVLRKGGKLVVLDWRPDALSDDGPPRNHRLSPDQVHKYLVPAGFCPIEIAWQNDDAYLVTARTSCSRITDGQGH